VLGLTHPIKNLPRHAEPLSAMGGAAGGLAGQCRVVHFFGRSPADSDERVLAQAKCNVAAPRSSLRFELDVTDVGNDIEAPLFHFRGDCEIAARELLNVAREEARREPTKEEKAAEWLVNYLFLSGPPYERLKREIEEDAKQHGISAITLRRASDTLGMVKPRGGRNSRWKLPDEIVELKEEGDHDDDE
jgi:hypothetical protein